MASSDEELALARARAKAKLRLRQQAAPEPAIEAEAPPPEMEGLDYWSGLAQTMSRGTLAGWGDEFTGLGRAALDYTFGDVGEEGSQSFPEAYKMYRDDARSRQQQFSEENPKTALGAELFGGIFSPINKIAPGLGTTGTRGVRTAQSIARGGAEGALAGLGEGQGSLEEQLQNAKTGGTIGGLASGVMTRVGGALGDAVSKQRIARDLGTGDNFIPAHLADPEGNVGAFYRKFVGNAIGGRGPLGRQESAYLRNNPKINSLVEGGERP